MKTSSIKKKSANLFSFITKLLLLLTLTISAQAGGVIVFGKSLKDKVTPQSPKLYAVNGFATFNDLAVEGCNITVTVNTGEVYQVVAATDLQVIQKSETLVDLWIKVPDGALLYVENQVSSGE